MIEDGLEGRTHLKVWDLIPWFVNGRLSDEDAHEVEAHLATCALCRDECAMQARIHDTIRDENSVAFASEASYRKLADRIEWSHPRERALAGGPRRMQWLVAAVAVQSVALAALGAWLLTAQRAENSAPYVTLSNAEDAAPVTEGSLLHIVFASASTLQEVQQLLRSIDGRMVDGPTDNGVYTIALNRDSAGSDESRLKTLRSSSLVRLAEPVFQGAVVAP